MQNLKMLLMLVKEFNPQKDGPWFGWSINVATVAVFTTIKIILVLVKQVSCSSKKFNGRIQSFYLKRV